MLLQARKANVGMVIATQDLSRASRAGIADTILGSTTTKIVSRVVTWRRQTSCPFHEDNRRVPDGFGRSLLCLYQRARTGGIDQG